MLWGCARSAPTLPTVQNDPPSAVTKETQTNPSSLLECEKLAYRLEGLEEDESALNEVILGDRSKNQLVGVLGAFYILPYVAAEGHEEEKRRLDSIQVERDGIYTEMKIHRCPTPTR